MTTMNSQHPQPPLLAVADDGTVRLASPATWSLTVSGTLAWEIELQQPSQPWKTGERRSVASRGLVPRREELPDGVRLTYDRLGDSSPSANLAVILEARSDEQGLHLSASVRNDDPSWTVRACRFPILNGVAADGATVLWPNGLGQRFPDSAAFGRRSLSYPGGTASMPWFALARSADGLYLGSHDPAMSARTIEAECSPGGQILAVRVGHLPFCAPGQSWTAPEFVVAPYRGPWQVAARRYRAWYDTVATVLAPSAWAQHSSGWLLAVLKQQNGDVMWDYRTGIDRLGDIALAHGLDTLGLFGWAHGGHDALYPDYIPDPLMGGADALRDALTRAKARGLRTVLYANGVIMDTSTAFYRDQADVRYLTDGQVPALSDYADNAYYPPDVELMRRTDPVAARVYLRALTDFERRHAAFLWTGRFLGDTGFSLDSPALVANAFAAGEQVAVAVWNPTDTPQPCRLAVPGRTLTACSAPETPVADPATPLPPESVRLYRFGPPE
jgi:hypothetical protein